VTVLVPGASGAAAARELAAAQVHDVVTLGHAGLEPYTPDGYTAVLQAAVAHLSPQYVLLPHTYQTRDFAPKLAARLDRTLITDVTAIKTGGETAFVRPMFQASSPPTSCRRVRRRISSPFKSARSAAIRWPEAHRPRLSAAST
jgi:electron transfer flavoprotein alpha subunit